MMLKLKALPTPRFQWALVDWALPQLVEVAWASGLGLAAKFASAKA